MASSFNMFVGLMRQSFGYRDAWRRSVRQFEKKDAVTPPPRGCIVFTGGSSFTFWSTMERDLSPFPVVNRGFGGATMDDVLFYAHRIVLPYKSRAAVLFAGGNDIVGPRAKSPQQVAELFSGFVATARKNAASCLICYIGITPTLAIWRWRTTAAETSRLILDIVSGDASLRFIDLSELLLDTSCLPDRTLYRRSRHPNALGYARWTLGIRPVLERDLAPHIRADP